ncbi:hypothetical protein TSAR_014474 [Trichomalopsis sarcophagae]|uniref:Uncharacterized protein n=1 Tax=Trichomalopsis sarcophagae TaxID=543379 RepID=A0A232EMC9_9HYME|nr:hypothetical protein TSAR_014474 [Trichomalopsis sarcophagae]
MPDVATAKMKHLWPLVAWILLSSYPVSTEFHSLVSCKCFNCRAFQQAESHNGLGRAGLRREVFFLNLEDGYFGCQVNASTDVLQLLQLSKLCDNHADCFQGSDEHRDRLKCTSTYIKNARYGAARTPARQQPLSHTRIDNASVSLDIEINVPYACSTKVFGKASRNPCNVSMLTLLPHEHINFKE